MKVVKEGKLPSSYVFRGECGHCKAQVQFEASEAQVSSHRNETYYTVKCPTQGCTRTISVEDLPVNRIHYDNS